jgi:hypothetical protein
MVIGSLLLTPSPWRIASTEAVMAGFTRLEPAVRVFAVATA